MSDFFRTFARSFARKPRAEVKRTLHMANWQDIRALEERIYDAVDEYLANSEAYKNAGLHVWLDEDDMIYRAEVDDNLAGSEDDGVYAIAGVLRNGDEGLEPDVDRISDIANSWIFLD